MNARVGVLIGLGLVLPITSSAGADDPTPEAVRAAIARALPPIVASMKSHQAQRDCFSCHHHAMGIFALSLAKKSGFAVEQADIDEPLDLTAGHLEGGADDYRKGKGQGGGVTTAGYGVWALDAGGRPRDETTTAVVEFFLKANRSGDRWRPASKRPPSEGSEFTSTFVALQGLRAFGGPQHRARIEEASARTRTWLVANRGVDNEDRVFRLLALQAVAADAKDLRAAAELLRSKQRADGGWSQLDAVESDAYATGSALFALRRAGGLGVEDPAYRRGLAFLVKTQRPDGTWLVKSRTKLIVQKYFESGFPHGKDQFISMSGTCWATTALLLSLEPG
jgi:hypothetical protein